MRLDAELLARTPSYLNPLKDREIDLRGHKIPAIENLGVTRDQLDSIDFTDNSISALSNFPLLRRLQHLHLSNNPVKSISPSFPTSLPNLKTLILSNAAFTVHSLPVIGTILGKCRKLETLSFRGCPIVDHQYYKEWIVFNCKKLRSLDFDRIKDKDKATAKALFLTPEKTSTALAVSLLDSATTTANGIAKTFEPGMDGETSGKAGRLLSKDEKERVRKAIEGASTVDEIRRLTRMLAQGFLPAEKDLKDLEKKKVATTGEEMETD